MDYTQHDILKASAQWYLDRDITVTRIRPGEKSNIYGERRLFNRDEVDRWVDLGGNLGFLPGPTLLIVDVDRKDHVDGRAAYEALGLPRTRTVKTPSGGMHFYFTLPAGLKEKSIRTHLPECVGIDFLSGIQNVVMPGSTLGGENAGEYQLVTDIPATEAPPHLLERLVYQPVVPEADRPRMSPEQVQQALDDIPNEARVYSEWFNVLAAVHHELEGSHEGRDMAHAWSSQSAKHEEKKFSKTWYSLGRGGHKVVTGGTLIHMAQKRHLEVVKSFNAIEEADRPPPMKLVEAPVVSVPPAAQGKLPGIAGELERWVDSTAHFESPELCRLAALHCISLIANNRYVVGESEVSLNLFSLVVAGTGSGKDNALRCVDKFAHQFMPPVTLELKPGKSVDIAATLSRVSSGAAIYKMLSRRKGRVWLSDEFGLLLEGMTRGKYDDVLQAFLTCFARPSGVVTTQEYSKIEDCSPAITHPYLSCLAVTTPEPLARALEAGQFMQAGLINRSIPVVLRERGKRRFDVPNNRPVPPKIERWAQLLKLGSNKLSPEKPKVIPVEPEAKARLQAFTLECDARTDMPALWSRVYENSMKLAGLVALGMDPERVTLPVMEWAINAVSSGYQGFIQMHADHCGRDPEVELQFDRIESALKALRGKKPNRTVIHPGSDLEQAWVQGFVTQRDLFMRLKSIKGSKELLDYLRLMEQAGLVSMLKAENVPGKKPILVIGLLE
jgi:hypothetical protein